MSEKTMHKCFALVPAAGIGLRMGDKIPKQYIKIASEPLILHTLSTLCQSNLIERVYVVLSIMDEHWRSLKIDHLRDKLVVLHCGGKSRAHSVLAGLRKMSADISPEDWVLVHDAARPCIASWHIEKLVNELVHDDVGGLLAIPVVDTLKRANAAERVVETIDRAHLWQAQTPQMFRYVMLRRALEGATGDIHITDEASAIEAAGLKPKLIMGDATNLKVTYPFDLYMAEWILSNRNS